MQVELTEPQRQLRDTVRAFAEARIKPVAAEHDRTGRFPREIMAGLGELGALGVFVPEGYGGAGFDHVAYALAVEEVSAACAATGAIFAAHASLAIWPILAFGSEAQRTRYLPRLATGEWLGCNAGAGGGITARRDGGGYVLNGTARF